MLSYKIQLVISNVCTKFLIPLIENFLSYLLTEILLERKIKRTNKESNNRK